MDIEEFYPSISEEILDPVCPAISNISEKDLRIIKHCSKSLLYKNIEPSKKKNTESCFGVTLGSFDGAEYASFWAPNYEINLINNLLA